VAVRCMAATRAAGTAYESISQSIKQFAAGMRPSWSQCPRRSFLGQGDPGLVVM